MQMLGDLRTEGLKPLEAVLRAGSDPPPHPPLVCGACGLAWALGVSASPPPLWGGARGVRLILG